jgi:hypothetical protein
VEKHVAEAAKAPLYRFYIFFEDINSIIGLKLVAMPLTQQEPTTA